MKLKIDKTAADIYFMKPLVSTLVALALAVNCLAQVSKSSSLQCPVTQLPIPSKKAAVGKSVYKGKTYYFCTSNCKKLFDKNPKKYAAGK
jgi:YHS domain-containing protein